MIEIECLEHCKAACCRNAKYITLSQKEAEMLKTAGTFVVENQKSQVEVVRREYIKQGNCGLENGGACVKHDEKPQVCKDFKPGGRACLRFRAENPDDVRYLIKKDLIFQNEYFGWDEQTA